MKYSQEELISVAGRLTERYTRGESTSVTYDRARQLMQAVIYCLEENEESGSGPELYPVFRMSAREAYEEGYRKVVRKTKAAAAKYSEIIAGFSDYGNAAYRDTVLYGLPEFFKKYDAEFAPQEHFLTLDYPLLSVSGNKCGIDLISEYIDGIALEQEFLHGLPEAGIRDILNRWRGDYAELFINIAGFAVRNLIAAALSGKKTPFEPYSAAERKRLKETVMSGCAESLRLSADRILHRLVLSQYGGNRDLYRYLKSGLSGFVSDLGNSAENDCMDAVLAL